MKPKDAEKELQQRIQQAVGSMADLTLEQGVRLMLDFYRNARAEGCPLEEDGDMLLFQWGTYDSGGGKSWQCDITRQFIESESEGDDAMSQLAFTFHFPPSPQTAAIKAGNQWCGSPEELAEFESFIQGTEAYQASRASRPATVSLQYGGV